MTDLHTQVETYLRRTSIPVDIDTLTAPHRPASRTAATRLPTRHRWRPSAAIGMAAFAVLLIGAPLLLFGLISSSPVGEAPGTTAVEPMTILDGTWERTVFEGGFIVEDLHATGFGLVAAAGPEGVWISADGTEWDQVLGNAWPQVLAPPNLAPPDSSPADPTTTTTARAPTIGESSVEAVVEYRDSLYAFGYEIKVPAEAPSRVVWRSSDGQVWEKTPIDGFPQVIGAVAGPDALLLVGRYVDPEAEAEAPRPSTVIFRSTDGEEYATVNTSGLEGFVVWAISRFGDGYVALAEEWLDRGAILSSPDGIVWEEVGPWTVSRPEGQMQPMNYSAWALVDLFETPYGLVAVGSPEPFNPQQAALETRPRIIVATSTDGRTFDVVDDQTQLFQLEDQRSEIWPPLQPPKGTIVGDQIILLGHSYPDTTGEPTYHQWVWSPHRG